MGNFKFALVFLIFNILFLRGQAQLYEVNSGSIDFVSEAKLELIKASSNDLKGRLDLGKKIFAFVVKIASFNGFNSPLQKEHFNENYMESNQYPNASFSGKIIEDLQIDNDGDFTIRAKGLLTIHGVARERIIKCLLKISKGVIAVSSNFTVQLAEHNIPIPKIVYEKLASEIKVEVNATMQPK
ncbi:MAG: YceI family protein [Bacteroidetes bacterium]|nr:YceI family protein [Bacteroidota bacterium]